MANVIKLKKGLDIQLIGKPTETVLTGEHSGNYAIVPDNFNGITPKVIVHEGDKVKAGSVLIIDKTYPEIKFVSPVSGEVTAVNRGEKRKVLSVVVKPDAENQYEDFGKKNVSTLKPEDIKEAILNGGLWPCIKQRPYDMIARPDQTPRDIFVSAFYSAPLAPNIEYTIKGQENDFQTGLDALAKLTDGKLYVGLKQGSSIKVKNAEVVEFNGPHPAGNVGVQINNIKPVNKGEVVWTLYADDVILIGRLLNNGIADFSRLVALTGSELSKTGYIKAIPGCEINSLVGDKLQPSKGNIRIISGNILTGTKVSQTDYLGFYDNQITTIPEGDDVHEFFGWATLGVNKFSAGGTFLSGLLGGVKKARIIDARIKGGKRAMIMSNEYDKVFPMDIFPEYLLKAIITFDIDKMENLGIYEVAPEDFALCEVVDTSKIEIQKIVRNGLDLLYKEMN
ncbi:Na(+)-translocating NADH-quinone reductase subunit A [Massilibacteroides sp.]|uniref:Na(+)-translocating NADH-quinone reductase subunit A n=1 Tax=Massilibacteroides sp. TaxID=2034766 RepID=UPI00262E2E02|nr:Na(+)-translocating NADH-quinone reductase subunit A [Massilibacteroides sp.]MDD4514105.1 Na(+)-translocating NADH-quinone reductase subunit A [Massilibacteroides sp.]